VAERNAGVAASVTCSYPSCNCPFDAPADPNWCARRLPKAARSPAALSPVADLCQVQCAGVASELKRFRLGIFMGTVGMFEAADGEYVKFADLHAQMDSADGVTKALRAAATSLETIADLSGRKTFGNPPIATFMDTFSDVRLYAAARARVAREALDALAAPALPPVGEKKDAWQPMATAPRDGTNILLRWGSDGVSQGKYIPGLPHPWQFIDTNDGITWLINHAVDTIYGPTNWQPMPSAIRDKSAPRSGTADGVPACDGSKA